MLDGRGRDVSFTVSLVVIGLVVAGWVSLCTRLVAWQEARAEDAEGTGTPGRRRDVRTFLPRQRTRPGLPEGHRPPPGLGPLSPSERFLTQEAARGLRDLQLFLVDQRA